MLKLTDKELIFYKMIITLFYLYDDLWHNSQMETIIILACIIAWMERVQRALSRDNTILIRLWHIFFVLLPFHPSYLVVDRPMKQSDDQMHVSWIASTKGHREKCK